MTAQPPSAMLYRVYNQGEIPSLAHGWRSVILLTPGRKWVTLIDWTTLETARIEIAAWRKLRPLEAPGLNRRTMQAVMRQRLRYGSATRPIQEALRALKRPAA